MATNNPSGSLQLSTLLNGYSVRPPWSVAGVDYAVGVPTGLTLQDPTTIAMSGVSVDAAHHVVTVTASNVTLSGYDFSLGGGWSVVIGSGVSNTTIENSNFRVGSNDQVPIQAGDGVGNLTLLSNSFDGSGGDGAVWALVSYDGSGTFNAEYNLFENAPEDAVDFSDGTLTGAALYNVFDNLGTAPGSHPDSLQWYDAPVSNFVDAFNTIYQPQGVTVNGMEGVQVDPPASNMTVENNTIIAKGPSLSMSYSIAVLGKLGPINGVTVEDNYIDATGAYGPFYPPQGSDLTFSGNVDLTTGAIIPSPAGTSPGSTGSTSGSSGSSATTGTAPNPTQISLSGLHTQYALAPTSEGGLQIADIVANGNGSATYSDVNDVGANVRIVDFSDGVGVFEPTGNAEAIARIYEAAYGRAPDLAGLTAYTADADAGTVTLAQIADAAVTSPEFIADYGTLSNTGFVTQLYLNADGRAPDPGGLAAYSGALAAGQSRGEVLLNIAESFEARQHAVGVAGDADDAAVYRLYETVLGRAPDPAGQQTYSAALESGTTLQQLAATFLASPEYARTFGAPDNATFVTELYANLLHRAPDTGGLAAYTGYLNSGGSRASVVASFVGGDEGRLDTATATHDGWVFSA